MQRQKSVEGVPRFLGPSDSLEHSGLIYELRCPLCGPLEFNPGVLVGNTAFPLELPTAVNEVATSKGTTDEFISINREGCIFESFVLMPHRHFLESNGGVSLSFPSNTLYLESSSEIGQM